MGDAERDKKERELQAAAEEVPIPSAYAFAIGNAYYDRYMARIRARYPAVAKEIEKDVAEEQKKVRRKGLMMRSATVFRKLEELASASTDEKKAKFLRGMTPHFNQLSSHSGLGRTILSNFVRSAFIEVESYAMMHKKSLSETRYVLLALNARITEIMEKDVLGDFLIDLVQSRDWHDAAKKIHAALATPPDKFPGYEEDSDGEKKIRQFYFDCFWGKEGSGWNGVVLTPEVTIKGFRAPKEPVRRIAPVPAARQKTKGPVVAPRPSPTLKKRKRRKAISL